MNRVWYYHIYPGKNYEGIKGDFVIFIRNNKIRARRKYKAVMMTLIEKVVAQKGQKISSSCDHAVSPFVATESCKECQSLQLSLSVW